MPATQKAGPPSICFLPLGPADEILDALHSRAQDALRADGGAGAAALVVVGAGTSDPDANGDLCKATRLVWERYGSHYSLAETSWVSLTNPNVAEAIDRCRRLGAERIVVAPYFLNTGVLLKRIDARIAEVREQHPGLSIVRSAHFGLHPYLLDLLEGRARAGFDAEQADRRPGGRLWASLVRRGSDGPGDVAPGVADALRVNPRGHRRDSRTSGRLLRLRHAVHESVGKNRPPTIYSFLCFGEFVGGSGPLVRWLLAATVVGAIVAAVLPGFVLEGRVEPLVASDAIIVISGDEAQARYRDGVRLYRAGWAPHLIFSGAAWDGSPSNAEAMRTMAIAEGIPPAAILVETAGVGHVRECGRHARADGLARAAQRHPGHLAVPPPASRPDVSRRLRGHRHSDRRRGRRRTGRGERRTGGCGPKRGRCTFRELEKLGYVTLTGRYN